MRNRLLATALAALLFAAQAEAQRQRSEALEIARSTLLRGAVRDVSSEELEQALAGSSDMSLNYALDALGVATGLFDQATSLSRLGEAGALGVLAFLSGGPGPEQGLYLFGWMPRTEARNPREAREAFQPIVLDALAKALPEHEISLAPPRWRPDPENPRGIFHHLRLDGPACDPCGIYSEIWSGWTRNPARVRAPETLGRYPAWRWGGDNAAGRWGGYPFVEGLTVEQRLLFFQELSRHLPEWAYFYLPPSEMLLDFPLMINQGRPLYFIEPAAAGNE